MSNKISQKSAPTVVASRLKIFINPAYAFDGETRRDTRAPSHVYRSLTDSAMSTMNVDSIDLKQS